MGLKQIDESSLERFVGYMRTKMEQNVDKPIHWSDLDPGTLLLKLKEELAELEAAIATGAKGIEVISECADLANFAMFLGFVYKYKTEVLNTIDPSHLQHSKALGTTVVEPGPLFESTGSLEPA